MEKLTDLPLPAGSTMDFRLMAMRECPLRRIFQPVPVEGPPPDMGIVSGGNDYVAYTIPGCTRIPDRMILLGDGVSRDDELTRWENDGGRSPD